MGLGEKVLLLDTSTELVILGLFTNQGKLIATSSFAHGNNLSKTLLPSMQSLLKERGLTPKDLSKIACGIGPGSYTGTRVGVAVAKSLAFALQIPIQGFCSLLAFIPRSVSREFSFLVPSRSGKVFVLQGSCHGEKLSVKPHFFAIPSDLDSLIQNTTCITANKEAFPFFCLQEELNLPLLISFLLEAPFADEDPELLYLPSA